MSDCCVKKQDPGLVSIQISPEKPKTKLWLPAALVPVFVLLYFNLEEGVNYLFYSLLALDRNFPSHGGAEVFRL